MSSTTSFWGMLSERDRADFEAMADRDVLPAGATVIQQRRRSYSVLIIVRGHVVVVSEAKPSPANSADEASATEMRDVLLAFRGNGDIVGEMAAITSQPRSATVKAIEEIEILEIDGAAFIDYLRAHFDAHLVLDQVIVERVREGAGDVRAERRKVPARVAEVLTAAADRVGRQGRGGLWLPYPRTQNDLARLIGASRESVSAALGKFRERGIVTTETGRMIIHDLDTLRKEGQSLS